MCVNRILETVQTVVEVIPIPENETQVVIPLSSFAISVQEIQPEEFNGQTFSVLDIEFEIGQMINATDLVLEERPDATASISVPPNIFSHLTVTMNMSNVSMNTTTRIVHSVYLTDSLFIRRDKNNLEVGSIIVAAAISGGVTVSELDPPITLTFVKNQVQCRTTIRKHACHFAIIKANKTITSLNQEIPLTL